MGFKPNKHFIPNTLISIIKYLHKIKVVSLMLVVVSVVSENTISLTKYQRNIQMTHPVNKNNTPHQEY